RAGPEFPRERGQRDVHDQDLHADDERGEGQREEDQRFPHWLTFSSVSHVVKLSTLANPGAHSAARAAFLALPGIVSAPKAGTATVTIREQESVAKAGL